MSHPLLAIKCKNCGAVYFAHCLEYPMDEELSAEFAEWVRNGDIPFIAEEVHLKYCKCKDEEKD